MESNELKIVLLQQDLHWENVPANLLHFESLIYGLNQKVDLIMLPEMFTTGFSMQPEKFALNNQEQTFKTLKRWAADKDVAICGSIMVAIDGVYFNRFFWVDPSGDFQFYDNNNYYLVLRRAVYSFNDYFSSKCYKIYSDHLYRPL